MSTFRASEQRYLMRYALSAVHRMRLRIIRRRTLRSGEKYVPVTLINGMTMYVNPHEFIGNRIIRQGTYSYEYVFLIRALAKVLNRCGTIIDAGANIGNHSLHFSTFFDQVLAFEPNPIFLEVLEQNLKANAIEGVTVFPIGLSREDGSLPYKLAPESNPAASRFTATLEESSLEDPDAEYVLEVRQGDNVLLEEDVKRVDAIKLDVEGHEVEALAGLSKTLTDHKPFLLFEYLPSYMRNRGGYQALDAALREYVILRPDFPHKKKPFGRFMAPFQGMQVILSPLDDTPQDYCDLIAVSKEDYERIPSDGPIRVAR